MNNKASNGPNVEALLEYLKSNRGFDFTGYKRPSLMRRISRRMQLVGVESFGDYQDYLEVHPEEFPALFNTILINVTSFFRDPPAWDYLAGEVIPRIAANTADEESIRVWSAGCASGQEAYSLAMVLAEVLGLQRCRQRVKIYATDVDQEALDQARRASYSAQQVKEVPAGLRDKYFEASGDGYVFNSDLRRVVIFGRHDLVQDAPISRLDLLVCRNTLIYFNSEIQRRILARFHFALKESGYLFLGKAEMLLTHGHLFDGEGLEHRIFSKVPQVGMRDRMVLLTEAGNHVAANQLGLYVRLREAAFDVAPEAQLVVDKRGDLILANDLACSMFGLDPRDLGRPFQDLEVSYRPVELRSMIEGAQTGGRVMSLKDVIRHTPGGGRQYLDVEVRPLYDNDQAWMGASVVFQDITRYHQLQEDLERSKHDLETAYEELQSSNEELETTNEELQSSNEELQTTNEELQSTNEEMETMNEELQSSNEELQAMNEEMRQRTAELNRSNLFLRSILAGMEAGVVAVDRDFNILLWNSRAEDLWGLRSDEVTGRSLWALDIGLPVDRLKVPLREFLAGESEGEDVVLEAINRRGRPVTCRISMSCLDRGEGQELEGAVLLMEVEDRGA
jgi:two-component system CheB/CheR fusion protein